MRTLLPTLCSILAFGCGSSSAGADSATYPERPICNGTQGFTLQIAGASAAWNDSPFGILWRNGFDYLRVDGNCNFYVFRQRRNDPILTGRLSEADARRLAKELSYAEWPELGGLRASGSIVDGALVIVTDGENEMTCAQGCRDHPLESDRNAARLLDRILDPADAWRTKLLSEGAPVDGNVRFAVAKYASIPHAGPYLQWPLADPIETYAVDRTIGFNSPDYVPITTGHAAEGKEASALRALRMQAAATSVPGSATEGWIVIAASDGGAYEVVVGDTLPYENADGLVPR